MPLSLHLHRHVERRRIEQALAVMAGQAAGATAMAMPLAPLPPHPQHKKQGRRRRRNYFLARRTSIRSFGQWVRPYDTWPHPYLALFIFLGFKHGFRAGMEEAMAVLSRDVRELSLGSAVERVAAPISPLRFLRDFVMPGKPCIVTGSIEHWGALHKWSNDYLRQALGEQPVSVHFTPDGRADSIVDVRDREMLHHPDDDCSTTHDDGRETLVFVTAHVQAMPFGQALDAVVAGRTRGGNVAYLQQQNDCLRTEFSRLTNDAEAHIPWATEALGTPPEAVNLWIGNANSVTSFHKDHYENLYAVVTGEKHFTLLPPVDVHRLYVRDYPSATYAPAPQEEGEEEGKLKLLVRRDWPRRMVPWVSVDPECHQDYPKYFSGGEGPFRCTVRAGEILYLPSMWFHHVTQRPDEQGRTIAINFWYDMVFDIRYAYFNFLDCLYKQRKA